MWTLSLIAACVSRAQARVMVLDMGSPDSALYPSAERVTPTDSRWQRTAGLTAHDAPTTGNPVWTNPFNQDCIIGDRENSFSFDAPAGKWYLYVLCGTGGRWDRERSQYWDFDVAVGHEVWRCQMEAPDWSGPVRFQHHIFVIRSTGRAELKLVPRSKWALSGVIAWRQEEGKAARQIIEDVEQWAPGEEKDKWREDVRPPAGPAPPVRTRDRRRGFYLWHRHWATAIYPWTNPTPEEMDPTLRIFASPGEHEPITFTVRPLRRIQEAEVEVSGLPIPADRIDIRKVRYLKARRNYDDTGLYRIVPDVLDRWRSGGLAADENATFWITVHLPDDLKPGLYHGRVTFVADGHAAEMRLELRVLDIRLQENPGRSYGIYYDDPLQRVSGAPDEVSRQHWICKAEMERADMVAHGTRNITLSCWSPAADEQGHFDMKESFALLQAQLEMNHRFGFQPPYVLSISSDSVYRKYMGESLRSHLRGVKMPPDAFFAEITALVRAIEQERRRRGWPEFVYQPYDEPGSEPQVVAFAARLFQAVKAAGVRTYTTAAPDKPAYQPMKPSVDIWCTQTFLPDHDTVVAEMRDIPGREYWCYPNGISGENDHTPVAGARMTYGFGFWRSGFARLIPWIYSYSIGDPLNYLDGDAMDFMVRSEPDGAPLPVALWEGFREGYDDMRYIHTLQQGIAAASKSPSEPVRAAAAQAEKVLNAVWNAIPVRAQYQYGAARGQPRFWSPEEMDVYRWMIADQLERLTQLMRS